MALHRFQIVVDEAPADEQIDALYARAGLLTRRVAPRAGEIMLLREAPTLVEAIASGIGDLEAVGLRPVRVPDEDWVTMGEIADRIGRSRECLRLWSLGRMGPGGFPPPLHTGTSTAFYSWAEVLPWLRERMGFDLPDEEPVRTVLNLALRLRALAPRIERMDLVRALLAPRSP